MYYLQSRYYDPKIGRFINADAFASTGQGLLGNNMFAYCGNNPVCYVDKNGYAHKPAKLDECAAIGVVTTITFSGLVTSASSHISSAMEEFSSFVSSVMGAIESAIKKKPVNLPSSKKVSVDIDHVVSGHMPDGPRNPNGNKTVFYGLTIQQVTKAIYEAYQVAEKLQTQGNRIRIRGFSGTWGGVIEMWINIATNIIETAYPK